MVNNPISSSVMTDKEEPKLSEELLKEAIAVWGKNAQLDIVCEELAELIVAIMQYKRGRNALGSIVEEIADVEIVLPQLKTIFEVFGAVNHAKKRKITRLQFRLREAKQSSWNAYTDVEFCPLCGSKRLQPKIDENGDFAHNMCCLACNKEFYVEYG
jgi:NTP pyrophosphatase (non-canonical NTP hydrolase)